MLLSKAVNQGGREVKKGQKFVNVVCERPHSTLVGSKRLDVSKITIAWVLLILNLPKNLIQTQFAN